MNITYSIYFEFKINLFDDLLPDSGHFRITDNTTNFLIELRYVDRKQPIFIIK